jgi:hypothetical protein
MYEKTEFLSVLKLNSTNFYQDTFEGQKGIIVSLNYNIYLVIPD